MRRLLVALAVLLAACGEPAPDLTIPERDGDAHVADQAGILDAAALESKLAEVADQGTDVVALTYETEQAGCGEAFRAAQQFVRSWGADVALVAVARPGDFDSQAEDRQRCLGVQPRDDRALPADLRERIAEELVPPKAARNDWDAAFGVAVDALTEASQ